MPLFTIGVGEPRVLQGKRITWDQKRGLPDIDIAAIEITRDEADELDQQYHFAAPSETAVTKRKTPGIHYLIAGYPAARNRITRTNLPSVATHLMTGDIRSVADLQKSDKYEDTHFALAFPGETVPTLNGATFRIPKPHGMSGGGVWRLDVDTQRLLATTPLLVGIGIEFLRSSNRFVATRIQAVVPLLRDLYDPETPWQFPSTPPN